jgi:hypothetical protein
VQHSHTVWVPKKLVRLHKISLNETHIKVGIANYLFHNSPIQNGLEQGDAISPLLFNFPLEYALRKACEGQVWLKLIRTHLPLAYADDVHLLGDNMATIKKNTEILIDANKETDLEINVDKTRLVTRMNVEGHEIDKQAV